MKFKGFIGVAVLFIIIQFVPVQRNTKENYQSSYSIPSDSPTKAEVTAILQTACWDCHSNQTVYPWYNKIAPISWYLARHINNGKKHLNFDNWNDYDPAKQIHKSEEIIEVIEENEMPLYSYTLLHPEAKLSEEQKAILIQYFSNTP
ncbi:heme-binding domain-containing protein [Chitinophagales bacterium]|nr:heme-binding domain-containing protein [Chitinophagales bacterium]